MESALELDQNLQGLRGIYRVADDLLITGQGDTKEDADNDHDANLVRLLQNCRERYIRLQGQTSTSNANK